MWGRPGPACPAQGMWLKGKELACGRCSAASALGPRKRKPAGAVETCPESPKPRVFLNSCPIFIVCRQDYGFQREGKREREWVGGVSSSGALMTHASCSRSEVQSEEVRLCKGRGGGGDFPHQPHVAPGSLGGPSTLQRPWWIQGVCWLQPSTAPLLVATQHCPPALHSSNSGCASQQDKKFYVKSYSDWEKSFFLAGICYILRNGQIYSS